MLAWIPRGLSRGRVTTAYPRTPESPPEGFQGPLVVLEPGRGPAELQQLCPTGAITVADDGTIALDRGRCILCGACVRAQPRRFAFSRSFESAVSRRAELIQRSGAGVGGSSAALPEDGIPRDAQLRRARAALGQQARALRRSIHVRHIDTGSDGCEEWEIEALWNPYYDIARLGFQLTSAPRHADILMASGGVTAPMREPLLRTWELMPEPKALIAVGTDACSGGLAAPGGLVAGGIDQVLPVDVYVPGSPPAPIALIDALLLAVGRLRAEVRG